MKVDTKAIIDAYNKGESMNAIAKAFGTYPITVKRLLEKNEIELRHDVRQKGTLVVEDGEKLIEWAKAQGRLVTKKELAEAFGKSRISPSYFIKYPELGQYIKPRGQNDLKDYTDILYDWLRKNNIQFKPNDRTKLKLSVDALLLGEYEGLAIQISIRPLYVSNTKHYERMKKILARAIEKKMYVLFLDKSHFENLDDLKTVLDNLKS